MSLVNFWRSTSSPSYGVETLFSGRTSSSTFLLYGRDILTLRWVLCSSSTSSFRWLIGCTPTLSFTSRKLRRRICSRKSNRLRLCLPMFWLRIFSSKWKFKAIVSCHCEYYLCIEKVNRIDPPKHAHIYSIYCVEL